MILKMTGGSRSPLARGASGHVWAVLACVVLGCSIGRSALAEVFTIKTPGGSIQVDIGHVDPGGSLASPSEPVPPDFRPPVIFSAPLPAGSGARALGFAGGFTAIADDATAASWNPAGLIQLERPEASAVYRFSFEEHERSSQSASYRVGKDDFESSGLNYLSLVYPWHVLGRNLVFSANYQEAYDFEQAFAAETDERRSGSSAEILTETYTDTDIKHFNQGSDVVAGGIIDVNLKSELTTEVTTYLDELFASDMVTGVDFEQEGLITAITPAFALEITPKVALGGAVNFYRDGGLEGGGIRSRTRATYSGNASRFADVRDERVTSGTYTYRGVVHLPPGGIIPIPIDVPISGSGHYDPFSETAEREESSALRVDGVYEEVNEYDDLHGINGTFGLLWTVSRHLSLGLGVDLPWTAKAEQRRTVRNTATVYDAASGEVVDELGSEQIVTKDVEFDFPLFWSLGGVWRWNNRLYSTLDFGQTLWSDFAFQVEGGPKINPFDGSEHGARKVDDCWSAQCGMEYLCVLRWTEIPLRAGVSWEQRPAVGEPDEYWGVSVGTGVSIGKDPGKLIVDVAYMQSWGEDVLGSLVPDQEGLSTDVTKQQGYVSCIWHF